TVRRKHTDASIARGRPSMSLFVGYFGTNRTYPELAHHSILLGPRYKGLLNDIFHKKVLADDFSLYLHAPTRSDASLAPAGHEGFYVLSPVPNNRSGLDWSTLAEPYFDRILDALDAGPVPGVKKHIVTKFSVDPRYFTEKMRAMDGAAFGLEPTLMQSAWFRFHNRSEDVDGLYFVGASTHPGAGVPGVLNSARVLERVVPRPSEIVPVPEKLLRRVAS
ncbi:MAG TPA: phytoene desaturase, partial [Myxococcota bacterium]|nr:phytoene desaturase [Myxococcota bacterium]